MHCMEELGRFFNSVHRLNENTVYGQLCMRCVLRRVMWKGELPMEGNKSKHKLALYAWIEDLHTDTDIHTHSNQYP